MVSPQRTLESSYMEYKLPLPRREREMTKKQVYTMSEAETPVAAAACMPAVATGVWRGCLIHYGPRP
jgi:hypothetical protein